MFIDSNKGNIKDQYHFTKKLAQGGFGVVYLAEHRQTKQLFAVKAIQKKKVKDYATFVNEINILKVLDHPHIIKLHEIWEWNDVCFLVLEYCQGGELFHFIIERKHLTEKEAAMIMKQLLSALVYLHSNNISHRDIKPENFMLLNPNDPTCVKMIDFGLSKDFSGGEIMSTMSGSPYYIAPEVFLQNYNMKIDIWSLGVVLYIMLSGKVPFPGNSELEIIGNVIKGDFHFNHEPFQRHSSHAKEFLLRLIQKDVKLRYTAEQAYNDPWIQQCSDLQDKNISENYSNDLKETVDKIKMRKVVLTHLCQKIVPKNIMDLQRECLKRDPQSTSLISHQDLLEAFQSAQIMILEKEFKEMLSEIDQGQGKVNYEELLSALYLTQMFVNELKLTSTLRERDTQNRGGLTIAQMKQLLQEHQDFQFPENALGATLKDMLGADINQLDPECIIDTDQFAISLRKEFDSICERSLSSNALKFK